MTAGRSHKGGDRQLTGRADSSAARFPQRSAPRVVSPGRAPVPSPWAAVYWAEASPGQSIANNTQTTINFSDSDIHLARGPESGMVSLSSGVWTVGPSLAGRLCKVWGHLQTANGSVSSTYESINAWHSLSMRSTTGENPLTRLPGIGDENLTPSSGTISPDPHTHPTSKDTGYALHTPPLMTVFSEGDTIWLEFQQDTGEPCEVVRAFVWFYSPF